MVDSSYKIPADFQTNSHPDEYILAAIDIGTNSIHMAVVKVNASLPAFGIIAKEKDTVRLGDRDPKTGNLTQEAMERAISTLQRCHNLAISLNAVDIIAVATSATREAPNGQEFLDKIESELGLVVNLISGQEEARRIYLGVLSGMDFSEHPHVIIDIGGGSTELILADSHEARVLSSTKVGAVRLTRDFISTDPVDRNQYQHLRAYVRGMLERPVEQIWANLQLSETPRLVGTSGTIQTLALVNALEKQGVEPNRLHGYQLSRQDLKDLLKRLVSMNYEQRFAIPGISDKRAEIIVAGAVILLEVMNMLHLDSVTICERSLREGIIVDWMLTHGLIEDRLHYQGEVRERNVFKIAHKYQVNLDFSQRVADFALTIFEQTRGHLHYWGAKEKELLWAAAILHNCGIYVSHTSHHKHSYYLIRNAEMLGFTELELELIASIARYHRKSKPKKKHENYSQLPHKDYQQIVSQLSPILRLAVALDRRQIGAIEKIECHYSHTHKELYLSLFPKKNDDECTLELWSLDYKKVIFEEEFNLKVIPSLETKSLMISS
jgi:exopolyphosphatase / guanosine-5'-triphosphate,3'-diphosphate pyrophosphatase